MRWSKLLIYIQTLRNESRVRAAATRIVWAAVVNSTRVPTSMNEAVPRDGLVYVV
jgi:hypothetical protein